MSTRAHRRKTGWLPIRMVAVLLAIAWPSANAQDEPVVRYGAGVPAEVTRITDRGLAYLAQSQMKDGSWGQACGITGIGLMAFLAQGEDPDFGRYTQNIRSATRFLLRKQNRKTGYIGSSMYEHGFAMLALAEAYGAVDDESLWIGVQAPADPPTIGSALELAVRRAVTSQERNVHQAWRYSPDGRGADTSVSGAVLMGLLAARNAGIEVPDVAIDGALDYFAKCTSTKGTVVYSQGMGGFGESMNRSSIATLVFAVGKRRDTDTYRSTLEHITTRLEHQESGYPFYFRYYMAQALFQGDPEAWAKWNRETTLLLASLQRDDGSFSGGHGEAYATGMSLLALALNYRFLPIYER